MPQQKATSRNVTAAERRSQALRLRKAHMTYEQIGETLGITKQSAHRAVMKALREIQEKTKEEAETLRALECERLDELGRGLWVDARQGNIKAVEKLLKVMERRARLLGLDAPNKIASTTPDGEEEAQGMVILPPTAPGVDEWLQQYRDSAQSKLSPRSQKPEDDG